MSMSKFIENAGARFGKALTESQLRELKNAVERKDTIRATDLVYKYAQTANLRSAVAISTSKGPDATIKYQTVGQRKRNERPTTAKSLTALTEQMYLGKYHIWSERAGLNTSDEDAEFDILDKAERVTLQENK